jgi:hypothetical protein
MPLKFEELTRIITSTFKKQIRSSRENLEEMAELVLGRCLWKSEFGAMKPEKVGPTTPKTVDETRQIGFSTPLSSKTPTLQNLQLHRLQIDQKGSSPWPGLMFFAEPPNRGLQGVWRVRLQVLLPLMLPSPVAASFPSWKSDQGLFSTSSVTKFRRQALRLVI